MHEEPAIDTSNFIQSHTPFESMANEPMGEKCVLVVGGESSKCREVATKSVRPPDPCISITTLTPVCLRYGFKNVVTPSDIYTAHRKSRTGDVSPFSRPFAEYHESASQSSMPMPISSNPKTSPSLQIGAIFVFHDSRDWGLDIQIILDVLLSHHGIIGTLSERNGDTSLPNNGYQQDGQPPIYFSNADLWWAADYRLPRLGQGGFRAALEGVWAAVTGGAEAGVELHKTVIGKPYPLTYEFAEKRLLAHRKTLLGPDAPPLKTVYMIGDNPESDVRGANSWQSPEGIEWRSILVGTGVYNMNTRPSCTPWATCKSILRAVDMAARTSGWHDGPEDYVKIRRRDRIIRLKRDRGEQRQQDGVQEEEEEVVGETPVSYAGRP